MAKKVKEVQGCSRLSWSPNSLKFGFIKDNELGIRDWNDSSLNYARITTKDRLNTIAWGGIENQSLGIIAGGTESGELELYNVSSILDRQSTTHCLLHQNKSDTIIKVLDFSRIESSYLGIIGQNEFSVLDLNQLKVLFKSTISTKNINNLSWNTQAKPILATCSSLGQTSIWDIRNQKKVLSLHHVSKNISSIAWHPDIPTQIITASQDDLYPKLALWDLRYPEKPEKIMSGHRQGIIDISWSNDPELLISVDKLGQVNGYNPIEGEFLIELIKPTPFLSHLSWCPTNPNIFSVCSDLGTMSVYTIQDKGTIKKPPQWIRPRVGARFGFGGKLVWFNLKSRKVYQTQLQPEPTRLARFKTFQTLDPASSDQSLLSLFQLDRAGWIQYLQKRFPTSHDLQEEEVTLKTKRSAGLDGRITDAVITGDFEGAVKLCLEYQRYSDALLFAQCGSEALLARTRQIYISRLAKYRSYLPLVYQLIVGDLATIVELGQLEWHRILVLLLTFAPPDELSRLCESLGDQMVEAESALICYMVSGQLEKVGGLWIDTANQDLLDLVEKITVFQKLTGQERGLERFYPVYLQFAMFLTDHGELKQALRHLEFIPLKDRSKDVSVLYDRLYHALHDKHLSLVFPFQYQLIESDHLHTLVAPPPPPSSFTTTFYSAHQQPVFSNTRV